MKSEWYEVRNAEEIASPALVVYPDRIEENIKRMVAIAGDPARLRPHVKTHKMAQVVRMQLRHGIRKFKCATIAEAEMTACCGAEEVLIAFQPLGPAVGRLFRLKRAFPECRIQAIADSPLVLRLLSEAAVREGAELEVFLDLNNGMNRTGIVPDARAEELYELLASLPGLVPAGLHVYDGHLHQHDLDERREACDRAYAPVVALQRRLMNQGLEVATIVVGGTPTFPIHAKRSGVELSPGTPLLWDEGYRSSFPDLDFLCAASLLIRVVGRPAEDLVCFDLGHKALASEMPWPRAKIMGIERCELVTHSEEHLVVRTDRASEWSVADVAYAVPYHICPTTARYGSVSVVRNGVAQESWPVDARNRKITI